MNSVLLHAGDTMDPDDVKVRKSPDYWVDPDTITEKGEPTFVKVDVVAYPASLYFCM